MLDHQVLAAKPIPLDHAQLHTPSSAFSLHNLHSDLGIVHIIWLNLNSKAVSVDGKKNTKNKTIMKP